MATIKEQREILDAYERGEVIEWRRKNSDVAFIVLNDKNHEFNFEYSEYRVRGKRWRAEEENSYYHITTTGEVVSDTENDDSWDDNRYIFGNYFRTEELAKKARELLKEVLIKFHTENE